MKIVCLGGNSDGKIVTVAKPPVYDLFLPSKNQDWDTDQLSQERYVLERIAMGGTDRFVYVYILSGLDFLDVLGQVFLAYHEHRKVTSHEQAN